MRIAWVLYGDLAQRTGGTIYDAEVVAGLQRAGDEVSVLSLEPRAPVSGENRLAAAARAAIDGAELARRMEAVAPDVVVGDELCFRELAVAFRLVGRIERAPKRVLLVHHLTAWEPELGARARQAARAAERLAIDASDWLVCTSRTTRERLVSEGVRERIDVVLPGADRLPRGRERAANAELRFLFLGSVVPRKRVLELVRAFGTGASKTARLVLAGSATRDEAYVTKVRSTIAEHELADRVELSGELDDHGVRAALDDAAVLVLPSSLEGYGIAATEAIHAGIPVIAARAQGLEEALAPCPDACVFADEERALAAAMARFATDASHRASMTAAAQEASSQMPTWSRCAAAFRQSLSIPDA